MDDSKVHPISGHSSSPPDESSLSPPHESWFPEDREPSYMTYLNGLSPLKSCGPFFDTERDEIVTQGSSMYNGLGTSSSTAVVFGSEKGVPDTTPPEQVFDVPYLSSLNLVENQQPHHYEQCVDQMKEVNQPKCGPRKRISFEAAMACENSRTRNANSFTNPLDDAAIREIMKRLELQSRSSCAVSCVLPSNSNLASATGKSSTHVTNDKQESRGVMEVSSATFQHTNTSDLILTDQHSTLCESPKRSKRKHEGCKFCSCKKTSCLKLYCQCFAAGLYCKDSCACEHCYNKSDYEDMVSEAREHTESRTPGAFSPKVEHTSATALQVGDQTKPSSGRHKRGCNCKKSKCLKKYCECYQAKVGCYDGCRCEACQNTFGKKPEKLQRSSGLWGSLSQDKKNIEEFIRREQFSYLSNSRPFSIPSLNPVFSLNLPKLDDLDLPRLSDHTDLSNILQFCSLDWNCSLMNVSNSHQVASSSAHFPPLEDGGVSNSYRVGSSSALFPTLEDGITSYISLLANGVISTNQQQQQQVLPPQSQPQELPPNHSPCRSSKDSTSFSDQ